MCSKYAHKDLHEIQNLDSARTNISRVASASSSPPSKTLDLSRLQNPRRTNQYSVYFYSLSPRVDPDHGPSSIGSRTTRLLCGPFLFTAATHQSCPTRTRHTTNSKNVDACNIIKQLAALCSHAGCHTTHNLLCLPYSVPTQS